MLRLGQYIRESADMDKLLNHLKKIGYNKYQTPTKKKVLVYVPKSDRMSAMNDLEKKLGGFIDKSPELMRAISSMGGIRFDSGPYKDMVVGVKPDQSKGLTTDEQETFAGLFIATKLAKPDTDFSEEDLTKYGDSSTFSKHKASELLMKASPGWVNSSTVIAEKLYPMLKGQKYEVHQRSGSKFEKAISTRAKQLIKESGHVMGLDKWNPADIWLVQPKFRNTNFNQFRSILDLNEWIAENFRSKTVMGVSLKQVGRSAKTEVFNDGNKTEIFYLKFDTGKTGFEKAINATVHFKGDSTGSFVLRSFGRPESISAEINGALAQGGKVGAGPLFNIMKRFDRSFNTMTHQQISALYKNDPGKVHQMLYDRMKKLEPQQARRFNANTLGKAIMSKPNSLIYVISKMQSSDVVMSITKMPKKKRDELLAAVISYAASSTEISSMFLKVS
jgi:hypothetical protein